MGIAQEPTDVWLKMPFSCEYPLVRSDGIITYLSHTFLTTK